MWPGGGCAFPGYFFGGKKRLMRMHYVLLEANRVGGDGSQ